MNANTLPKHKAEPEADVTYVGADGHYRTIGPADYADRYWFRAKHATNCPCRTSEDW